MTEIKHATGLDVCERPWCSLGAIFDADSHGDGDSSNEERGNALVPA